MEDKVFNFVLDALNSYRYCPLCDSPMILHRGSSNDVVTYNNQVLTITNSEYRITINIDTDRIEISEIDSQFDYEDYSVKFKPHYTKPQDGLLILGMNLECGNINCTKYCYTLSFELDLTNSRFKCAMLNAEWVCIEDGSDVFEIRNNYGYGITKYSHHLPNGSSKFIEVPLIPINSAKPKETLERLKKLIIFS